MRENGEISSRECEGILNLPPEESRRKALSKVKTIKSLFARIKNLSAPQWEEIKNGNGRKLKKLQKRLSNLVNCLAYLREVFGVETSEWGEIGSLMEEIREVGKKLRKPFSEIELPSGGELPREEKRPDQETGLLGKIRDFGERIKRLIFNF